MRNLKWTGFIALLAWVTACQGADLTSVAPPPPESDNTVGTLGVSSGRMLTTQEAISFLEAKARKNPAFLDIQRIYSTNGHQDSTTFRNLLSQLQASRAKLPTSVYGSTITTRGDGVLAEPTPPIIVGAQTTAESGLTGVPLAVVASMGLIYSGKNTVDAMQTIRITGIGDPFEFPYTKPPSQTFPWTVAGSVNFATSGGYKARTVHSASAGSDGQDFAESEANAIVNTP